MLSVSRIAAKRVLAKSFSSAANPRLTIAQNFLILEQLQHATDEAGLAAAKNVAAVDLKNLPSGLSSMETFLNTPAASATGFQHDSKSWHYYNASDYVAEEATRNDHFPFMLSGA
jgi:hypothetical protein